MEGPKADSRRPDRFKGPRPDGGKTHDARDGFTEAAINDMCGGQNTLKAALLAGAKRNATVLEKVFSTGTGSSVSPATPAIVGAIGWTDLIGI